MKFFELSVKIKSRIVACYFFFSVKFSKGFLIKGRNSKRGFENKKLNENSHFLYSRIPLKQQQY